MARLLKFVAAVAALTAATGVPAVSGEFGECVSRRHAMFGLRFTAADRHVCFWSVWFGCFLLPCDLFVVPAVHSASHWLRTRCCCEPIFELSVFVPLSVEWWVSVLAVQLV